MKVLKNSTFWSIFPETYTLIHFSKKATHQSLKSFQTFSSLSIFSNINILLNIFHPLKNHYKLEKMMSFFISSRHTFKNLDLQIRTNFCLVVSGDVLNYDIHVISISLKNNYNYLFQVCVRPLVCPSVHTFVTDISASTGRNDFIFDRWLLHGDLYRVSPFQVYRTSTSCLPCDLQMNEWFNIFISIDARLFVTVTQIRKNDVVFHLLTAHIQKFRSANQNQFLLSG
jgi:hypothetical protein